MTTAANITKSKKGDTEFANSDFPLANGAHAHDHDLQTVFALELFEAVCIPETISLSVT